MCWKFPCEPIDILACCYLLVNGKWQYHRDLSTLSTLLPPEWVSKIKRFHETWTFKEDIPLGYIIIYNDDGTICSILVIMLYDKEDRIVVDFIDVDEWLRFVNSRP